MFFQTLAHGNSKIEVDKQKRVKMERSSADMTKIKSREPNHSSGQVLWAGREQIICLCRLLHTTGSCSQASRQTFCCCSLNWYMARIQEWCNHWCTTLNSNKIKALVVSRSRTMSPTHGDLVLPGVSIGAGPRYPWSKVWQKALLRRPCAWYCVPCLSERIGTLW